MSKKLTITVDDEVYAGLHTVVGRRRISRFLNDLARPHVLRPDLTEGYGRWRRTRSGSAKPLQWVENLCGDIADEPR